MTVRASQWTLAVSALATLALGMAAGITVAPKPVPAALAAPEAPTEVSVTTQEFTGETPQELTAETSTPRSLRSAASGLVTRSACESERTLSSGRAVAWLDDVPLLGLATPTPLWRDLAPGARGADVQGLQAELRRLGHTVPDTGVLDARTLAAYRAQLKAIGRPDKPSGVPRASLVWLPAADVGVRTCAVAAGASVAPGEALAELTPTLTLLQTRSAPRRAIAGDLALTVDGVTVPVDEKGRVTDPVALTRVADTPSFRRFATASTAMNGTIRLAQPVLVSPVPPSALYRIAGSSACVLADGTPTRVTVAGSELGRTFVRFATERVPARVAVAPGEAQPCT